jgi:peptidoglycan hydrolase-like protein with peptidoglycan-binding domain
MADDFTIVLKGVDTLHNRGIIVQTIREGLKDVCREAGKKLNILIDRGIERKRGDLVVDFNRVLENKGPGIVNFFGEASDTSARVNLDEHYSRRLERGIRNRVVFEGGRKVFAPDYTSQIQSLFDFDEPEFARFIGNTALHEIGHMLGHKGSRSPMDVMYDAPALTREHGWTVESNRRYYSRKASFLTDRETIVESIKTGKFGEGGEKMEWHPPGTSVDGIKPIKKKFSAAGPTSAPDGTAMGKAGIASITRTPASSGRNLQAPLLRRGSRGSDVAVLQKTLGIQADGVFGQKTERAVRDFQRRNNLQVDGIAGPRTLGRLASGNPVNIPPISGVTSPVRLGSRGQEVLKIQTALGIKADGIYGPKTDRTVRDFQRKNNLRVDGIVGPQTRGRLFGGSSTIHSPPPGPSPLLRRGSRGRGVTGIQQTLGIKADGIFGPKTDRAVRDFQRKNNLRVDGIVGPQTRGRLFGNSSPIRTPAAGTSPLVRRGSHGTEVMGIQRTLGIKADGIFGPKTDRAVRDFQRRNNIRVDGIVGPQTRGRLFGGASPIHTPVPGSSSLLRRGSRGPEVMGIQRTLGIKADGMFGPKTDHAIRDFQRRNNLRVDGIVGPRTQARLFPNAGPQARMGVINPLRSMARGLR